MQSDLETVLSEMNELNTQAITGMIDRERWLDFVAYLERLGCPELAKSWRKSLEVYDRAAEWLHPRDSQSPVTAERE